MSEDETGKVTTRWYVADEVGLSKSVKSLEFTIESEAGRLTCVYDAGRALVSIFNTFGMMYAIEPEELETLTSEASVPKEEALNRWREKTGEEVAALCDYAHAQLIEQIQPKLEEALWELCNQVIVQAMFDLGVNDGTQTRAKAFAKLERDFRKKRHERVGIARGGSEPVYNLSAIYTHYSRLLPIWQEAKRVYRRNRAAANWPAIVQAAAGELPADLVARLADNPILPEEELARIGRHGGGSSASDIAHEHAARECGLPPYTYTLRHLQERVSELRRFTELQRRVLTFGNKQENTEGQT